MISILISPTNTEAAAVFVLVSRPHAVVLNLLTCWFTWLAARISVRPPLQHLRWAQVSPHHSGTGDALQHVLASSFNSTERELSYYFPGQFFWFVNVSLWITDAAIKGFWLASFIILSFIYLQLYLFLTLLSTCILFFFPVADWISNLISW